jgi:hypothetical protein
MSRKFVGIAAVVATAMAVLWFSIRAPSVPADNGGGGNKRGAVTVDSLSAMSVGHATATSSDQESAGSRVGSNAPRAARVPIAPASKAWRFEGPTIGDASAGTLYTRLAQRDINQATARDAAVFAEVMRRCRHRAKEQALLRTEESGATKANEFQRQQTDLLRQSIRDTDALCGDAPEDAATRSDAWLTRAAELGDPVARYYFAAGRLGWVDDVTEIYKNPERLAEYKPRALEYLQELARQGHYDSMMHLSTLYLSPVWGQDIALSWAYVFAAARSEGDTAKQARFLKQLESLPPDQRARAEREADRIYGLCCK